MRQATMIGAVGAVLAGAALLGGCGGAAKPAAEPTATSTLGSEVGSAKTDPNAAPAPGVNSTVRPGNGSVVGAPAAGSNSASGGSAPAGTKGSEAAGGKLATLPDPKPAAGYTFAAAGSTGRQRFAAVSAPIAGLYDSVQVLTASSGGSARAEVAVYSFPAARSGSKQFQAQIVGQLVHAASGVRTVGYGGIDGRQVSIAKAPATAVGWFENGRAVIVLSRKAGSSSKGVSVATGVAYAYLAR